jgi:acyl-homoserine-lactone acylase
MTAYHDEEAVMRLRAMTIVTAVTAAVAIAAPPALASRTAAPAQAGLSAQISYTTGGVPHILAHGWTSLGFGYGYVFAQDNLCTMANDYVTVEAQRSRYFGPTGVDIQRGNGFVETNLDSDLYYQQIINSGIVQRLAQALSPTEQQVESGYVRGYNAYLAHVGGSAGVPDPPAVARRG